MSSATAIPLDYLLPISTATLHSAVSSLGITIEQRELVVDALLEIDGVRSVDYYAEFNLGIDLPESSDMEAIQALTEIRRAAMRVFDKFNLN